MLRSLFSGISGMKTNQTRLDVIGNNIANVSTTGFKSSRVTFQDLFSQTISNSQGPTDATTGGINAKQVGLGVQMGSISTNMTDGSLQTTGYSLDFAIDGDGFFIVSDEYPVIEGVTEGGVEANREFDFDATSSITKFYTRDGSFSLDYEGNLVTSSGYRVLGYVTDLSGDITLGDASTAARMTTDKEEMGGPVTDENGEGANLYPIQIPLEIIPPGSDIPVALSGFAIDGTGLITAKYGDTTYYLGKMGLTTFANPQGLEKQGGNLFTNTNNSGMPKYGCPSDSGFGKVRQGTLEMSNVDLATEFTEMIITSRAYQANSRTIRTSDEMLQELINLKR